MHYHKHRSRNASFLRDPFCSLARRFEYHLLIILMKHLLCAATMCSVVFYTLFANTTHTHAHTHVYAPSMPSASKREFSILSLSCGEVHYICATRTTFIKVYNVLFWAPSSQ